MRFTSGAMCHGIPVTCNLKLPRCYTKMAIMAEQLIVGMWPTISYLLSLKQHSVIPFVSIPHIDTKRKLLTKVESPNILVHVVATYDALASCVAICYISLTFTLTLTCLPRITEWYEDIRRTFIRHTIVIQCIIFCCNHL